jgi:hypothetical protein
VHAPTLRRLPRPRRRSLARRPRLCEDLVRSRRSATPEAPHRHDSMCFPGPGEAAAYAVWQSARAELKGRSARGAPDGPDHRHIVLPAAGARNGAPNVRRRARWATDVAGWRRLSWLGRRPVQWKPFRLLQPLPEPLGGVVLRRPPILPERAGCEPPAGPPGLWRSTIRSAAARIVVAPGAPSEIQAGRFGSGSVDTRCAGTHDGAEQPSPARRRGMGPIRSVAGREPRIGFDRAGSDSVERERDRETRIGTGPR